MHMDKLMFPVPLLHARAEKTDPVARMLLASLQRHRGCMEVLAAETDGGLKLNCNIKFCCELSPPWCFIMTFLCQMHCYCLVSITSMNTSFIYIYAKFQFLLTLLGCWKSHYLHFSTAAWLLPVAELSIVWCIFMWLSFSVKTFVKLYFHSLSTSVWCSHKLLWGGWTWHDPAGARTWL